MSDADVRRRPGGRSARVRAAVIEATNQLLRDEGLSRLTVSEVARRAQVNETSIYRRWGTRENLVMDALLAASEPLGVPDTGSLREDLTTYVGDMARLLATPAGRAIEHTLAAAGDDPAARRARDRYWSSRTERSEQMVTRAVERGEVPPDTDPRLVLEMVVSPVHFRVLLTRDAVPPDMPGRLVDALLDGIGYRPAASRTRSGPADQPGGANG